MTDNEIIKTLECCSNDECSQCPLQDGVCSEKDVIKDALSFINRQKAEIEALRMDNQQLQSDIANANMNADHALAEVERLKANNNAIMRTMADVHTEAIKEFAERLKEELRDTAKIDFQGGYYYLIGVPLVDNLVEEMVGDNGGSSEKVQMAGDRI